jgi:peptidoglycan/LPS O-acetylase OafA/YrhL
MKLIYRPEIDGLRAVAVGAVILYHAKITIFGHQIFKGGFIGVDIFFVISGYLITSIILKELVTTGSFSFKHFYERRIRRIIPALLFVMLVSIPFAWMYLLPSSFVDFSKSILYSLVFSSNFYFHYSGQRYDAESGSGIPFLHTWSLSVEEQYYILFPIVLLFTYKFFRKYLIHILTIGFIISLGLAEWTSRNYPSISFYFLHTRMWELLAGSILAYFEITKGHRSKNQLLNITLPIFGLVLISHSIIFFDNDIFHPSFFTLSPVIGVCLIIWFSNKDELITKVLSIKLFVGIGLISYSLYLWHYPIFAFVRITEFSQGSLFNKLFLGTIILALSIFSYYFIEKPFRNRKHNFLKILIILSTSILIIIIFNLKSIYSAGFKKGTHFPEAIVNTLKTLNYREISQNGLRCHNRLGDKGFCIFNELSDNEGDIVLLGDSLTDAILGNLIEQVSNTKYRLIHMSYSGNLFLPNFVIFEKKTNKIISDENIHNFRKEFLENKTHKNTYIIIYGDYNFYFEKRLRISENVIVEYEPPNLYSTRNNIFLDYEKRKIFLKEKIKESLINLSKNKKVLLIYPSPVSPVNILQHINRNRTNILKDTTFYLKDKVNYSINFFLNYNSEIYRLFNETELENLYKIKLESIFCPKYQCIFYDNKNSYIFDFAHPSYEGSKMINDLVIKEIEKIELKSK